MSLTSHIAQGKDSPVGRFFCERFCQTATIAADANRQLRNTATIRPTISIPLSTYSTIGSAIDYRIRYSFANTPSQQLTAWTGAWMLALKQKDSVDDVLLDEDELTEMLSSHTFVTRFDPFAVEVAHGPYPASLLEQFFANLDKSIDEIRPAGRRLDVLEESLLARYCYVLSLFESVYRQGIGPAVLEGPLFQPNTKKSTQELLDIPAAELVEDICRMSWLFQDKYSHLLLGPAFPNPVFAGGGDVGGADGDLIVAGCLIELKASVQTFIKPDWLRQLAGYLLLDYRDTYNIEELGIYMARQGLLFTWTVEEFLRKLTGDPSASVQSLREELRACLKAAKAGARRKTRP